MINYPNAKINLGLHITARRQDGYHNLETIFYPIPLHDVLRVETEEIRPAGFSHLPHEPLRTEEHADYVLHTSGISIDSPAESNLIIKAFRDLQKDFTFPRLHIHMHKQIPSGAGLGGGSSDAAFMMKLLNTRFSLKLSEQELEERLSRLGADCAFFVRNRPTFATGIGNVFSPVPLSLQGYHLVLVKPDIFVSTREAFSQIEPHRPTLSLTEIVKRPVEQWKDIMINDFEEGIFQIHPAIGAIKDRLYALGADYAAMSGSGSSVFGIFRQPLDSPEQIFNPHFCTQSKL